MARTTLRQVLDRALGRHHNWLGSKNDQRQNRDGRLGKTRIKCSGGFLVPALAKDHVSSPHKEGFRDVVALEPSKHFKINLVVPGDLSQLGRKRAPTLCRLKATASYVARLA